MKIHNIKNVQIMLYLKNLTILIKTPLLKTNKYSWFSQKAKYKNVSQTIPWATTIPSDEIDQVCEFLARCKARTFVLVI